MRVWVMAAVVALAGCADAPAPGDDPPEPGKELKATETTGVIRGVVVDAAIAPVEGVEVELVRTEQVTVTDENGFFGFEDVEPGTQFLEARKPGWGTVQSSADVVAGEDRPDVVKIQMVPDPSSLPHVQPLLFEGIIVCSFSLVAVGFAACSTANMGDEFLVTYDRGQLGGEPQFAQSEMVWESTQAAGDRMNLLYSAPGGGALLDNYGDTTGTSPIMVNANRTVLEHYGVPAERALMIRVFNAPIEGTDAGETIGDPRDGDDCFERPVLGGCTTGLGATIDQTFDVYTHAFFGFEPFEGWRFTMDGEPLPP